MEKWVQTHNLQYIIPVYNTNVTNHKIVDRGAIVLCHLSLRLRGGRISPRLSPELCHAHTLRMYMMTRVRVEPGVRWPRMEVRRNCGLVFSGRGSAVTFSGIILCYGSTEDR